MSSASSLHAEYVSGPSSMLAFLRALYLKITGAVRSAWSHIKVIFSASVRIPGSLATAVTSMASSRRGYETVIGAIKGFFRALWRGINRVGQIAGRVTSRMARMVVTAVGHVSPEAADALYGALVTARTTIHRIAARIDTVVTTVGDVLWMLLNTTVVRAVSTAVAGVSAAILVLHDATRGAFAAWLVNVLPAAHRFITWITNPWWSLAAVVASTFAAMGLALVRLLLMSHRGEGSGGNGPDGPAAEANWSTWQESLDDEALDSLVKDLHVSVAPDGSVTVSGIPDWVPVNLRNHLAKVASEAVIKQWQRTVRQRPTPSRDDRRLFTKVARDAVRGYASGPTSRHRQAA